MTGLIGSLHAHIIMIIMVHDRRYLGIKANLSVVKLNFASLNGFILGGLREKVELFNCH